MAILPNPDPSQTPVPTPPPIPEPKPMREPDPDRLPDEEPIPNPDENDAPPKHSAGTRCRLRTSRGRPPDAPPAPIIHSPRIVAWKVGRCFFCASIMRSR